MNIMINFKIFSVSLSCGGSASENCTYISQTSISKEPDTDPCTYTICKCQSDICRIRFDFIVSLVKSSGFGIAKYNA